MKKKLEAELISIAHRILKLKNKSELVQLHQEVQKLYEKLSVLRFLEEQFDEVKPTIGRAEIEAKLETLFEEKPETVEVPSQPLRLTENEFVPIAVFMPEEVTEDRGFEDEEIDVADVKNQEQEPELKTTEESAREVEMPHVIEVGEEQETEHEEEESETESKAEEQEEPDTDDEILIKHVLHMDELAEEDEEEEETESAAEEPVQEEVKSAPKEISFADLLGHDFSEPVFERLEDIKSSTVEAPVFEKSPVDFTTEPVVPAEPYEEEDEPYFKADVPKVDPSHEAHHKAITFGLNDKIGFEKHLFGGSSEDMNRVVSQLGSFDTFEEAKEFIEDMVKPDYNNWEGKEDYEQRFMEIIEKKFN